MNDFLAVILICLEWLNLIRLYMRMSSEVFRRWWVKPHIKTHMRELFGAFDTIFNYFVNNDHENFRKMVRMSVEQFEELHGLIHHRLQKRSLRQPLSTRLRLAVTLSILAHGDNFYTTSNFFRIGLSTTYSIIAEVCPIIWECLQPLYLKGNIELNDWIVTAEGFRVKWDLPNCIGAIDGKEIAINKPENSGSIFFNYKKFFSFKLMAMCDSFCRFSWVDIGDYGSVSDVSAFQQTEFYRKLENNLANLPNPAYLPNSNYISSYFIVGDGIFALKPYMMVPYKRNLRLTRTQQLFNYRLSKARQTIECAFGILSARWQILKNKMSFKLKTSIAVVQALVCLHNFIITRELVANEGYQHYFPEHLMEQFIRENQTPQNEGIISDDEVISSDGEEDNVNEPDDINPVNADINEYAVQSALADYFMNQ
ncbi:protein ALP1-like [Leptopilina heterotoma]|uniref:protein ALP1-like n=1 Tax=Leptopilina heterotoma TaxID=63436 RepID=UPI001CA9DAC9|nr:protein ALP1-like [Leptopilina heterotoma]XP_043481235.1 protein ALP1-like [Leptopilina heterotoma]